MEARDLLEIVEAHHQHGSTIFCSQFDPRGWHDKIGEATLADAILDTNQIILSFIDINSVSAVTILLGMVEL